ncbi:toll/interleukin-1 receptor domain-containing protein [Streptococcus orisratti]|uniref:toll/interleukin-1 receptor domain-containing protein n=1 Tax=Streptococcus orisratti TaxID=114652 RepID=UPI002943571A|nr:toll/interleukin-1 receptor domain-containing protein [Streptococcus orisratti]
MSKITLENQEARYIRELAKYQSDFSRSLSKENKALEKSSSASQKLLKAKTTSRISSLHREIARENKIVSEEKKRQARYQRKISELNKKLGKTQSELTILRDKELKAQLEKIKFEQQQKISQLEDSKMETNFDNRQIKEHDIFFSYAHENSDYADSLVKKLLEENIDVVFDKNDLKWGDSIVDFINEHMIGVKFAIILVTPEYLSKYWTQYELKSLLQRHSGMNGESLILPIWHNITKEDIAKRNIALTDFNAMVTTINSQDEIVDNVKKLLQ